MEGRQVGTRRAAGQPLKKFYLDEKPTLALMKDMLLSIESLYTDTSAPMSRQWDYKEVRDKVREQIESAKTVSDFQRLLLQLDQGFSHPQWLRYKNSKEEEESQENEDSQDESNDDSEDEEEEEDPLNENQEDEEMKDEGGDENVTIMVLKLFKYWPYKELRSQWRDYVFQEVEGNNINALSVAIRILDRVNSEFLQRQIENQQKKIAKENRQFMQSTTSTKVSAPAKKEVEKSYGGATTGRSKRPINYQESDEEESVSVDNKSKKKV